MQKDSWILDVITDLKSMAVKNNLLELGDKLEEAAAIAEAEIDDRRAAEADRIMKLLLGPLSE